MENITSKGTIFGTLIAQAGPKGETGKTGDRGLTGEAGYSPVKGIDYFTQEDIAEIREGIEGDLTGEYIKNAIEKTNIFNTNAKETTTSFDLNAENKTKEYNDNALAEIEKYNSNAIEKSSNFDINFENKTSKFDSNYDEKIKEFNDNNDLGIQNYNNNAKKQMEIFDTNFTEKLESFNNNAGTKFNGFNTNSDKALAEYNKNHTDKMKEYDDNSKAKLDAYNKNNTDKTNAYNANDIAKTKAYNDNTVLKEKAYNDNATSKTETFNTNAESKQNEFNENAAGKLAEYNQNAEELINKVEQVQAENEALKAENKLIKEQIPSASVSGNSIHVEDSGSLDLEWRLKGGNWQETRDGRQLFNKNDYVGIYQGYYDNGVLNKNDIRHNWIIMKYEKVNAELSYYYKNTANGYNIVFTNLLPDEGVPVLADGSPYYYKTTSPDNSKYVMFYIGSEAENDWNFEERLNSLMVEETSERLTANDYEQYGASPSPSFPSEVETVKDSVEIDVVNKNIMPIVNLGTSWEYTERGIKSFGKNKGTDITKFYIKKGQTIKFGLKLLSQPTADTTFTFYVDNTTGIIPSFGRIQNLNLNQVYERSYTADKDCEIKIKRWGDEVSDTFEFQLWAEIDNLTDYIQHQSQTAIMPIQQEMLSGDYISNVEHHEWGEYVLTGEENWNMLYGAGMFHVTNLVRVKDINSRTSISNYFKYNIANNGIYTNLKDEEFAVQYYEGNTTLYIKYLSISTVEEFKTWLKSKYEAGTPITIYYKLETPFDLELTEEQKAVRDTKLYTYKNITNISLSDELASIDVEYKKNPATEHDDLQNQIDEIKQLISTTQTSALLLDNLQKDVEMEVE